MKTIYKYPVHPAIDLPMDAEIIDFSEQNGILYLWALVDTNTIIEKRNFLYLGTGYEIPLEPETEFKYIKTTHAKNGLVWHLFEIIKFPPTPLNNAHHGI